MKTAARTEQGARAPLASIEQVAEYLGVPVKTLYGWRYRGTGPRSSKVGKHVRYRWVDVDAWVEQQTATGDR